MAVLRLMESFMHHTLSASKSFMPLRVVLKTTLTHIPTFLATPQVEDIHLLLPPLFAKLAASDMASFLHTSHIFCQFQYSSKRNACYVDLWDSTKVQTDACFHLEIRLAQHNLPLTNSSPHFITDDFPQCFRLSMKLLVISLKFILNLAYYHSLTCFWS